MTIQLKTDAMIGHASVQARTELSFEFEAMWRALPRDGLVPNRSAFLPERAPRFLRHLLLCEALPNGKNAVRIRLIGSEFEHRVKRDLRGLDYLQFLPESLHRDAIESVRHIVQRPCGLWQLTPVHYERGFSHLVEFTIFPLEPGANGVHLLLVLTQSLQGLLRHEPTNSKVMSVGTALSYQYVDVGAGVPDRQS
jgi:hypothetical protein